MIGLRLAHARDVVRVGLTAGLASRLRGSLNHLTVLIVADEVTYANRRGRVHLFLHGGDARAHRVAVGKLRGAWRRM